MDRQNISSGAPWEAIVGYSRAVRFGNTVYVGGTAPVDADGQLIAPGDPYGQARFCFEKIERALRQAGALMSEVVRTRMYVTDISQWEAFGRAHAEFFADVRPVATMVEVSRLIGEGMLIEVEAEAIVGV